MITPANDEAQYVGRCIFLTLFIIVASSCSFTNFREINADSISSGTITDKKINEASGIAVSRINQDVIWIINDSGTGAIVFGVNSKGKHIFSINIQGVINNDWEDLASFEYKGKPYILIADVGDNEAKRIEYYLHIIQEPDLKNFSNISSLMIKPSWSIAFAYEDGPRDCEAVAVDVVNEKILLLSKRDRPPVLYELPLTKKIKSVAKRLGEIKPLPPPTQKDLRLIKYLFYTTQPTGMDISKDGLSAIVLTYASAYYYCSDQHSDWLSLFLTSPKEIVLPFLQQAESVCFSKDGTSIYVTSEKIPSPLLKVDLKKSMKNKKYSCK